MAARKSLPAPTALVSKGSNGSPKAPVLHGLVIGGRVVWTPYTTQEEYDVRVEAINALNDGWIENEDGESHVASWLTKFFGACHHYMGNYCRGERECVVTYCVNPTKDKWADEKGGVSLRSYYSESRGEDLTEICFLVDASLGGRYQGEIKIYKSKDAGFTRWGGWLPGPWWKPTLILLERVWRECAAMRTEAASQKSQHATVVAVAAGDLLSALEREYNCTRPSQKLLLPTEATEAPSKVSVVVPPSIDLVRAPTLEERRRALEEAKRLAPKVVDTPRVVVTNPGLLEID